MLTHFAPAERSVKDKIFEEYTELKSASYIKELIAALPYIAVILNQKREMMTFLEQLIWLQEMSFLKKQQELLFCISKVLHQWCKEN